MFRLLRAALVVVLAAIVFQVAFAPRAARRALDPDEPIAADGLMIAGGARTIYDTNPAFGAFGSPPRPDPDDPKDFEQRIKDEKWSMDHSRDAIAALVGPPEWSSCDDAARKKLIAAVQIYYRARGGQKNSFAMRGPRAKAAIEKEWSTNSCAGRCNRASSTRTKCRRTSIRNLPRPSPTPRKLAPPARR